MWRDFNGTKQRPLDGTVLYKLKVKGENHERRNHRLYYQAKVTCNCGNEFVTGSTKERDPRRGLL